MIGPFAGDEKAPLTRQTLFGAESFPKADVAAWCAAVERGIRARIEAGGDEASAWQIEWNDQVGFLADTIWMRMRARLWAQSFRKIEVRYPADWWQALRARFAPAWWLRRHPVVEVVTEVTPRVVYPRLGIAMPRESHVLDLAPITYRTDAVADDDEG